MSVSPALRQLELSMDTPDSRWLEDFDLAALQRLTGEEVTTATQRLVERLETGRDARAARALGVLGTPEALAGLAQAGLKNFDEAHIESLLALEPHQPGTLTPSSLQPFFESLNPTLRRKVVHALRRGTGEDMLLTLELGLYDEDELVRSNVYNTLVRHHRLEAWGANPGSTLSDLSRKLGLAYRACWHPAAQKLGRIFVALREDQPVESLGLDRQGLAFSTKRMKVVSSLRTPPGQDPWADRIDVTSLLALSGFERELTVDTLFGALSRGDYRVPEALLASEDPRVPAVLAEAFPDASGRLQLELALALVHFQWHPEAMHCLSIAAQSSDPVLRARAERGMREGLMRRTGG
ncbi:MAG: hypothetical protein ACKO6N_12200 [Myxococcota bacterium]